MEGGEEKGRQATSGPLSSPRPGPTVDERQWEVVGSLADSGLDETPPGKVTGASRALGGGGKLGPTGCSLNLEVAVADGLRELGPPSFPARCWGEKPWPHASRQFGLV